MEVTQEQKRSQTEALSRLVNVVVIVGMIAVNLYDVGQMFFALLFNIFTFLYKHKGISVSYSYICYQVYL